MTTIPFAVREARQVSDLAGQPAKPGGTESQGFFGRVANLRSGGPPQKESPEAGATAIRANKSAVFDAAHSRTGGDRRQGLGDRLRELARDVRRIGGRDPEAIAIAKDDIAVALVGLAQRLEGGR